MGRGATARIAYSSMTPRHTISSPTAASTVTESTLSKEKSLEPAPAESMSSVYSSITSGNSGKISVSATPNTN